MKRKIVFNSEIREEVIDDIHGVEYALDKRIFDSLDTFIGIYYAAAEVARHYEEPVSVLQISSDVGVMLRRYLKRVELGACTVRPCEEVPSFALSHALLEYSREIATLPSVKRLYPEIVRQFRNTPEAEITAAYMVDGSVVIDVFFPDDCEYWR